MARTTFQGPVRSLGGIYQQGPAAVVDIRGQDPSTANNEGVVYTIWVPTTISTSSLKIGTNGTDKFVGSLISVDTDSSGAVVGFTAGASNDFINLNGTTTGGVAGTCIQIVAIAANKYMVQGQLLGSGIVATPFADS
jgi:hypothetical protein